MMKTIFSSVLILFFSVLPSWLHAQNPQRPNPDELFKTSGEVYFSFHIQSQQELESLTRIISIDNVTGTQVRAYANREEFAKFAELGYDYEVLPHPGSLLSKEQLRPSGAGEGTQTIWNYYPAYQEYLDIMDGFAANFPDICKLVPIGTSVQGRELLAVKISDNVNEQEAEPEFLYTSSIHGDELTGYVLMLHLIDYLTSNYGTDPRITEMVDHTEIIINPLANPDGTFFGGNGSVYQAQRYNANWIDLNRNYPDPEDGPHPDGNPWQVETEAFMAFADSSHFVMGANFHGGAEVFNYPWDTWAKLAADDFWWRFVGREYVDTVHIYSPTNYFSGFNNGITNGYQWYTISGGRQDYMNYFHSCREVTLEISDIKLLPASQLLNYWEYNYRSLLNYIEEANYGVQGTVTDSVTGEPLLATVYIAGHDVDNSYVTTKLPSGYYSRLLFEGSYGIRYSAPGYFPRTIYDVSVINRETTHLDVQLVPLNISTEEPVYQKTTMVFPNPSDGLVDLLIPGEGNERGKIECFGMNGAMVFAREISLSGAGSSVTLDLRHLPPGLYLINLYTGQGCFTDRVMIR